MSTLDTAESVLGIGERGADRLEDDMDTGDGDGRSGGSAAVTGEAGAGLGNGGADGRAFWDVEEGDEVRLLHHILVRVWCVVWVLSCVFFILF